MKIIAAAMVLATTALMAGDKHPADEIVVAYTPELTVPEGGSVDFTVTLTLPNKYSPLMG